MEIDLGTLRRVPISRNVAGTSERGVGIVVGEWLAISRISKWDNLWGIFVLDTGKLLIDCRFTQIEAAYEIATLVEKVYRDYWVIISRDGYPDLSLFRLCQYTIPDGQKWMNAIQQLETQEILSWINGQKFYNLVGAKYE